MKKITFLFVLLAVTLGYSQQEVLQDFENGGLGGPFGNPTSVTLVPDPETGGTRGTVAEIITSAAGNVWQGTNVNIDQNVLLTTDKTMTLDVYATAPLSILVKVTASIDGGPDSSVEANHTGSGWESITVTFNTSQDNSGVANGTYSNFVVYPNWDSGANNYIDPPIVRTVYFDNITGTPVAAVVDPVPDTPAPTPSTPDGEVVLSIFNDVPGYTNAYTQEGEFGIKTFVDLGSPGPANEAIKVNFSIDAWGQFNNTTVDVSAAGFFNFSYYIPTMDPGTEGHQFGVMINSGTGDKFYNLKTDGSADGVIVFDSWQTVSVPMSFFTAQGFDPATFLVWKLAAPSAGFSKLVYFDNIFFSVNVLSTDTFELSDFSVSPNPTRDNWIVKTNNQIINSVVVFDILGKQVLMLTPNSSEVSIDATELNDGVYLTKIITSNGSKTVKLIKQ